jgi:hypothetical protein
MNDFVSGASMMGAFAIALFFMRSFRRNGDRLFLFFALAFGLLSLERWILVLVPKAHEYRPLVYLMRLVAFGLIAVAIVDKNRDHFRRHD